MWTGAPNAYSCIFVLSNFACPSIFELSTIDQSISRSAKDEPPRNVPGRYMSGKRKHRGSRSHLRTPHIQGMMPKNQRLDALRAVEKVRGHRVVSMVLGDRPNLETRIANDALSMMASILERIGKVPELDLFLYSTGGMTIAGFALVNLLREYTDKLCVLVPYKAYSTATLICLGADELLMTPLASLSPVDPSVNSPLNPLVPNLPPGVFPPQTLPVSVEDVVSYLDLAREEAGLKTGAEIQSAFLRLAEAVHPLALGSVHRARTQIRMLARKLLATRRAPMEEAIVSRIVDALTKELYSHDYMIARKEAKAMGFPIGVTDEASEKAVMQLYRAYETDLLLVAPYAPENELGNAQMKVVTMERALIESTDEGYVFEGRHEISRVTVPQGHGPSGGPAPTVGLNVRPIFEGWRRIP
jgi:hypothetical protein